MKASEIITEARLFFYHGSKKLFEPGFILKPQPDGYVHGNFGDETDLDIRKIEKILEKYRPANMISRYESVFLVDNKNIIENVGGHANYIYMVQPIGECQKACLNWYSEIESNVSYGNKLPPAKLLKEWALNYWNAVYVPTGLSHIEYRCREAKIIKRY